MEITHVTNIDGLSVGEGTLGKITKELSDLYHQVITGQLSQYRDWLTGIY